MILVASQRSGAVPLADHLMNDLDNDHVEVIEIEGFMANDLHGAFKEAQAISKATRCKQFLFSVSLNPPEQEIASDRDFRDAADRVAKAVGLEDQPRAIVVHEKNGRRHAHAVWSRIDAHEMKSVQMSHFKAKLRDVSRDLFLEHGWPLPDGLATYGNKNPLNFTLAQWQQAQRQGYDPREIKQIFRQAWERSDGLKGFQSALADRGFYLAQGDRRGFIAVDVDGNFYSVSKWAGVKVKDVTTKLGDPTQLPSVTETQKALRARMTDQVKSYIHQVKTRHAEEMHPFLKARAAMVEAQRAERLHVKKQQKQRWIKETKERSARLNKGLRGLFDRLTGKSANIRYQNEREAMACAKRDQQQRDDLITAQIQDRRDLQKDARTLKSKHKTDRKILAKTIADYLRRPPANSDRNSVNSRSRKRARGPDLSL
ncbi:relaxase/mobilization nuclease domain-containing protein [Epibacterium sp. SM1969]|uniref:Relaxase/mobilization nuclease domain-containing protein n=1 Tax=Tritonibacter aquimaris TaxID=2663379 RepID=A0A844AYX9_9RHOB|nr:relaxase/mobilization nuclease domain-containing protein [Tritonibacter aquimaris]MQY43172.1 relaxase/mobilization nuclease domain-containing protein [Tritonibacter aquimaris]